MMMRSSTFKGSSEPERLRNALNPRKPVKPRIKRQDPVNAMLFHNREVYGIAGG